MLLYLHGFRSSPRSTKARQTLEALRAIGLEHAWSCPQLPASPAQAATLIETIAKSAGEAPLTVIGSSLGGYYATWLASRLPARVVLLNPAVHPERDLAHHLGRQTVYHSNEAIDVLPEYLDELSRLSVQRIADPARMLLVAARNDEVLSIDEMLERYADNPKIIVPDGGHALTQYPSLLGDVLGFLGFSAAPTFCSTHH